MPPCRSAAQLPPATLAAAWDGAHIVLAHCDGSISALRDGQVVSVIMASERVTVLHTTSSHIYLGFESGKICKFDAWTGLLHGTIECGFEPCGIVITEKEVMVWGRSSRLVVLRRASLELSHVVETEQALIMATQEYILLEDGTIISHNLETIGRLGGRDEDWVVDATNITGDTWLCVWRNRWALYSGFEDEFGAEGPSPFNRLHVVGTHLFLECDDGNILHIHQNHVNVLQDPPENLIAFLSCGEAGVLAITRNLTIFSVDRDHFNYQKVLYPVDLEPCLEVRFENLIGYPDGTVRKIIGGKVVKEWTNILPSSVVALNESEAYSIDTKVSLEEDPPVYSPCQAGQFREYYHRDMDKDHYLTFQNIILPREPSIYTAPLILTELSDSLDKDEVARKIAVLSSVPLYEDYTIMRPSERAVEVLVQLWSWNEGRVEALINSGGLRSLLAIAVAYPKINVTDWLKARIIEYLEGDIDEKLVAMRVLAMHPTLADFPFAAVETLRSGSPARSKFLENYARGNPEGILSQSSQNLPTSLKFLVELVQKSDILDKYTLELVKLSVTALPSVLARDALAAIVRKSPERVLFHREQQRIVCRGPGEDATLFSLRQSATWVLRDAGSALDVKFTPAGDAIRGVVGAKVLQWSFPGTLASIFNRQENVLQPHEIFV